MKVKTEYPLLKQDEKKKKKYFMPHISHYKSLLQNLWDILITKGWIHQ